MAAVTSTRRRVASNTAVQVFGKLLVLAMGAVSITVLTRYLGPDRYGRYTFALMFTQLFGVLADVGLFTTVVREISKHPDRTEELVGNVAVLRLLLSIAVIATATGISLLLPYKPNVRLAILLAGAPLLFGMLTNSIEPVFQARLRMGRAATAEVIGRAVALGLAIAVASLDLGFYAVMGAAAGGAFAALVAIWLLSRPLVKLRLQARPEIWRAMLIASLPLGIALAINQVYVRADTLIISLSRSYTQVGFYTLAYRILELTLVLGTVFLNTTFPVVTRTLALDPPRARRAIQLSVDVLAARRRANRRRRTRAGARDCPARRRGPVCRRGHTTPDPAVRGRADVGQRRVRLRAHRPRTAGRRALAERGRAPVQRDPERDPDPALRDRRGGRGHAGLRGADPGRLVPAHAPPCGVLPRAGGIRSRGERRRRDGRDPRAAQEAAAARPARARRRRLLQRALGDQPAHPPDRGGAAHMTRVLVISAEPVGPLMAGPAIRALELARALSRHCEVTLAAPAPSDAGAAPVQLLEAGLPDFALLLEALRRHDVVVAQTLPPQLLRYVARLPVRFVADLYNPLMIEVLEAGGRDESSPRRTSKLMLGQCAVADFIVCASEKQRDLWLGGLALAGLLDLDRYRADPTFRSVIDTVPFGLPEQPAAPAPGGPVLKGVLPGIEAEDRVLVWAGGIWRWLDPLTPIRAVERLRADGRRVHLVFLGTDRPAADPATVPTTAAEAIAFARERGLEGSTVHFIPGWLPYGERDAYLLEADLGVCAHHDHLEARFSFRTRALDHFWAGLPSVLTGGDAIGELVDQRGLGRVVAPGDADAFAAACAALLDDEGAYTETATRVRAAAPEFRWSRAAAPLIRFCLEHTARPRRRVPAGVLARATFGQYPDILADLYERGGAAELARRVPRHVARVLRHRA